ncbi:hypothetical protein Tco_0455253 [Tanacetum coccineum]
MRTKIELTLEQTQQGVSNEVLAETGSIHMLSETPKVLSGIEDSHHGPSDAMHNPPYPLKELESMECQVESLMRSEVLLDYEGGFTFLERPYQEEFKARILNLIDDQEDQIRQLEEHIRKTKETFMCLTNSLIGTLKVK